MKVMTWLTLGRVSNLPSIWTNIIAAVLVTRASLQVPASNITTMELANGPYLIWLGTFAALSLMYLGGMFLNDAFDAKWDKAHQQPRPIVQGQVSVSRVWAHGSVMLALGIVAIGVLYQITASTNVTHSWLGGWLSSLALAGFIISYNAVHKTFALAPLLMGMCRFCVYLTAGLLLAQINAQLLMIAAGLCAYICGVTYSAKNEHLNQLQGYWSLILLFLPIILLASIGYSQPFFWLYAAAFTAYLMIKTKAHLFGAKRNVGAFIGSLLAGIPLHDGLALASMNLILPSLLCFGVFLLMPYLQRFVSAT